MLASVSSRMMSGTPVVNNHIVGEMNFATQIFWILSLGFTTLSAVASYGRIFKERITTTCERRKLYTPAILIFIWAIGSVGYPLWLFDTNS